MGGLGSGRTDYADSKTIEHYPCLSIANLMAKGIFNSHRPRSAYLANATLKLQHFKDTLHLQLKLGHDSSNSTIFQFHIPIVWTPCHFGGERAWFKCPTFGCNKRTSKLYFNQSLACRTCHNLSYTSQRATPDDRRLLKAEKIRKQLGWVRGIGNPDGGKPKGMHWKTFYMITHKHTALSRISFEKIKKLYQL